MKREKLPIPYEALITQYIRDEIRISITPARQVGYGINDAPARAQSDIGIRFGSGSEVTKETGGIVLIRDDLRGVVKGIKHSKVTMHKIKQNLFWVLAINTLSIPITADGLLNPMIAAAVMALSSLTAVGNAALLKRYKFEKEVKG